MRESHQSLDKSCSSLDRRAEAGQLLVLIWHSQVPAKDDTEYRHCMLHHRYER